MSTKEKAETIIEQNQWQIIFKGYLPLICQVAEKKNGFNTPEKGFYIENCDLYFFTGLASLQRLFSGQLDEKVFFAGQITPPQILILMHDHQTHHIGR